MIAALEEHDGGEELEFYKQSCTERFITYTKAKPIKTGDGLEGYITASYRTWRWGVLAICTNRGGGFSKGNEEPSKVKQAMINRSQAVHVRRHDGKARPPDEFETHQGRPEVQRRRRVLRIMTNLALLVRMMLLWQPHLRPDMTVAQDLWRKWDERLVKKFGLTGLARRRNDKRTEDCVSACVWEAVWEVFGYKQTSALYPEISKKDDQDNLPPFHPSQLYEVIRILQPSQELILDAWTRNLELAVSTSRSGTNVMSILAEAHSFDFTDLLRRSVDENKKFNVRDYVKPATSLGTQALNRWTGVERDERRAQRAALRAEGAAADTPPEERRAAAPAQAAPSAAGLPFAMAVANAPIHTATTQPAIATATAFRSAPAQAIAAITPFSAAQPAQTQVAPQAPQGQPQGQPPPPPRRGPEFQPAEKTRSHLFSMYPVAGDQTLGGDKDAPPKLGEIQRATRRLRVRREAIADFRTLCLGSTANGDEVDDVEAIISNSGRAGPLQGAGSRGTQQVVDAGDTLDTLYSRIAPDVLFTSIFYSVADLLKWSINEWSGPAESGDRSEFNPMVGTHAHRHYVQDGKFPDGKTKYDFGWVRVIATRSSGDNAEEPAKSKGFSDFRTLAKHLVTNPNKCPTQARFCYHEESIKDTLYLLAHNEENARMVPQMPYMAGHLSPYDAMEIKAQMANAGKGDTVRPYSWSVMAGDKSKKVTAADSQAWAKRRHPDSLVEDSDLQRRVDGLVLRNRLFAVSIISSNKIHRRPPIRVNDTEVQVNAGILTDHCALLAEATLAAASIPGLKNAHEKLPGTATAPTGLSMSAYDADAGRAINCKDPDKKLLQTEEFAPRATLRWGKEVAKGILGEVGKHAFARQEQQEQQEQGDAPAEDVEMEDAPAADSRKRKRNEEDAPERDAEGNSLSETVYCLPYSYDIVSIHLAASMAGTLFDDELESDKEQLASRFGKKYGFHAGTEHAQVTLPFPGFLDEGRQLISLSRRTESNPDIAPVAVRDGMGESERVTIKYVSACLGRIANMHDLREWCSQRAGSSQYYGVTGNLYSQSVWRRHALAALQARGMISSPTETAANIVRYRSSQLWSRLVEYASKTATSPYEKYELTPALANSYRAVEEEEEESIRRFNAKRNRPMDEEGDEDDDVSLEYTAARALSRDTEKLDAPSDI